MNNLNEDDQLWYCNSSPESWMSLSGRCYLAHVKKDELHKVHLVAMS